jgi:hypothetical protein
MLVVRLCSEFAELGGVEAVQHLSPEMYKGATGA